MEINYLELRPRRRTGRSVKSTDTDRREVVLAQHRMPNRRGICAAIVGAAVVLLCVRPGHAQGTDEERRQMEIEGNKRLEQRQKQQQDRATDKAKDAGDIERFQRGEQSREDWIRQLENRNKQR